MIVYSPIVELRRYTLHSGKRDVLIDLFEKFFIETHEELGAELIGQFRELDNPDLFVWLRGFVNMETRGKALENFYSSPIWKAHREEANQTMLDSDNVLLLREAWPGSGFHLGPRQFSSKTSEPNSGIVIATIWYFDTNPMEYFVPLFRERIMSVLTDAGGSPVSVFVSEYSPNNFPKLPVREGENVLVWFSRFENREIYLDYTQTLEKTSNWSGLKARLQRSITKPQELLQLAPTLRSKLT